MKPLFTTEDRCGSVRNMPSVAVEERLINVFRKVFRTDSIHLSDNLILETIPGWDSLTHIHIIVAIEREFNLRFTTNEVSNLKDLHGLITLIERKTDPKLSSAQE
jgi:acyl carrier protein